MGSRLKKTELVEICQLFPVVMPHLDSSEFSISCSCKKKPRISVNYFKKSTVQLGSNAVL